jgi:predicted extracellular nuclease
MNRNLAARILRAVALALPLSAACAPALAADHVVISQVYGGGGSGVPVTYKRDYVELFNPTASTVSLAGWSLQYGSASGTGNWSVHALPATLSIAPGQYLLIEEGGGTAGADLPVTPDVAAGSLNLSATAGKLALVGATTALAGACPTAGVIDRIGYGSANCAEGGAATAVLTKESGAVRKDAGCTDTDDNAADFEVVGNPVPRNGASPLHSCSSSLGGRLRITEFMYQGSNGEFVEFTNVGDQPVDTAGWSYADSSRVPGDVALDAFGTVQPGESVILTDTAAGAFRAAWGLCPGVKVIGGNATDNLGRGDEINLYDASQALVDRLTYGDNVVGVGGPRTQNVSAWPSAAALGANQITGWTLSAAGNAESAQASVGGDVASPGRSAHAIVAYDPCFVDPATPQVTVDAAATSPFLDLAASGEGAASGVIDDPTDPAAIDGIAFAFAAPGGDASALTIAATSDNPAVVDAAGLQLSGSGAQRLLKIVPRGVGYATIRVSATDSSQRTGTYAIRYAASAAAPSPADTVFLTGASDASATVAVDPLHMLVADDETNVLRLYRRDRSGLPLAGFDFSSSLNLTDPANPELDLEGSARLGDRVFWTGSFSNSKSFHVRPNRHRVFATDVAGSGASATLSYAGRYDWLLEDMVAWDQGDGHGLGANALGFAASSAEGVDSKTPAGFNIEGLAIAPDGSSAYLAFRAPQLPTTARHQALIVPVRDFDALVTGAAPGSLPQGSAVFGVPIFLDLGGRGIRSLDRNAAGQYLITAGAAGDTGPAPDDFRLYAWTGLPADAPVELATDLTAQDIAGGSFESLAELPSVLGTGTILQALLDNGDSVWYGDGIAAKDLAEPRFKKAASLRVVADIDFPANTVATSDGTPQSATVNQPFAAPLVARVTDAFGNGIAGVSVGFAAPASGASATLSAASAVTGADGRASVTATANAVAGSYEVVASVSGAASSASFALTNTAGATPGADHVVISQVYGGGGATSLPATYKKDYIELYNPTAQAVDIGGWSLQYASATGTGNWFPHVLPAGLSIAPGQYLLIEEGGGTVGGDFPLTPDVAGGPLNLSQSNGKIALVGAATALSGACPTAGVVDQVGYGTANCFEGTAATAALGKELGAVRKNDGCTDSDDNAADFDVVTNPVPRNGSSPLHFCDGSGGPLTLSVGDVAVTAPTSGTAPAQFIVTLSRAADSDVHFDLATVDGSAVAGVDYVAATQAGATISAGGTTFQFVVQVNANNTPGAPKTFKLHVGNISGGGVITSEAEGTATIANSTGRVPIGAIQGDGAHPAMLGQPASFSGTVTAIGAGGYFVQDGGDGNPLTSDAVFVYGGVPAALAVGDSVDVSGTVAEFYGLTEITGATTTVTGSGALPPAITLDATTPSPDPAHPRCEGGSFGAGDSIAVRNWRCLQSMRVTVADAAISAPNFRSSSQPLSEAFAYVASQPRPFRGPGLPYGTQVPSPPAGYDPPIWDAVPYVFGIDTGHLMSAQAFNGGMHFSATGVMGFDFGIGMFWPTEFAITDGGPDYPVAVPAAPDGALTIGSQNMLRLFNDVHDSGSIDACADTDPGSSDVCPTSAQFQVRLQKLSKQVREVLGAPAVLGTQEIENLATLQALADQIHADDASLTYHAYLEEGNDVGGIDVGVLVRSDVTVNAVTQLRKSETTNAGCSPSNPPPCLLNDRPPLLLDASFAGERFAVLVIHNRSLSNVETQAYVRAKRLEQAMSVARIAQAWQTGDSAAVPGATAGVPLAIVGDYNAFEFSDGYVDVTGIIRGTAVQSENLLWDASLPIVDPPLFDAGTTVPDDQLYSFSYDGYAQDLDHGLVTADLQARLLWMGVAHGNSDVPAGGPDATDATTARRSADHDGFVMAFAGVAPTTWTVTPSVSGGHGQIDPAVAQTVVDGATTSFTLNADPGYHVDVVGGTCPVGSLAGNVYTTGAIVADCTVTASFAANAPAAIAVDSGDAQSVIVGQAFAAPLVVRVTDAGGQPLAGVTVTFTAPASGASAVLAASSAITDADGKTSITASANGIAGAYAVQAEVAGVAAAATFQLSNLEDPGDLIFRDGFELTPGR